MFLHSIAKNVGSELAHQPQCMRSLFAGQVGIVGQSPPFSERQLKKCLVSFIVDQRNPPSIMKTGCPMGGKSGVKMNLHPFRPTNSLSPEEQACWVLVKHTVCSWTPSDLVPAGLILKTGLQLERGGVLEKKILYKDVSLPCRQSTEIISINWLA